MFAVDPRKYAPKPPHVPAWVPPPRLFDTGKLAVNTYIHMRETPYARALRAAEQAEFARDMADIIESPRRKPMTSAAIAKRRLRVVITAEREAFPDWRWVCTLPPVSRPPTMVSGAWSRLWRACRARYRWERRQ